MTEITAKLVNDYSNKFFESDKNKLAQSSVRQAEEFETIITDHYKAREFNEVFTNAINVDVEPSNQESSGRCWLYSILNVIRLDMIQQYKLDKDFELSQAFPYFWDLFEKCNYFLKCVIKYRKDPIDSRYNRIIFDKIIDDGGCWNMVVNIVNKYGLVPKNNMDETFNTKNPEQMHKVLKQQMLKFGFEIREMPESYFKKDKGKLEKRLKEMLYIAFKILQVFIGTPPDKVNWSFYQLYPTDTNIPKKKEKKEKKAKKNIMKTKRKGGKRGQKSIKKGKKSIKKGKKFKRFKKTLSSLNNDKNYAVVNDISPVVFYKEYIKYNCDDKIVIGNCPYKDRPYYTKFKIDMLNNMDNDNHLSFINVPIDVMMTLATESIDDGEALWFAADIDKGINERLGILDTKSVNYKNLLSVDLDMSKGERLFSYMSSPNHAMVLKGYNVQSGNNINKWLVENSWGDESSANKTSNMVMSSDWFKENVYEVIIDKKYCSQKILDVIDTEPVMLKPWDPWGFTSK